MSESALNGLPISQGELLKPYEGAWVADLTVITDTPIRGAVKLQMLGQTYSGTVVTDPASQRVNSGIYAGQCYLRVVGGAGGLTKTVEPNTASYDFGATAQQVLADLLGLVGERLADDIAPELLARQLPKWSWTRGPVDGALGALVDYLGVVWTVREDGAVWLGTYDPANSRPVLTDFDILEVDARTSRTIITADTITVRPGQAFAGLVIREVLHQIRGKESRTQLTFDPGVDAPLRRLMQRAARRGGQDYSRPQPGKVARQLPNGVCEVQLDSDAYPPLRNVPIDLGLPDSSVKVEVGARVLVEWQGGLPTAPVITAWGQSRATTITVGVSAVPAPQPTIRASTFLQALIDNLHGDIISAFSSLPPASMTEPLASAIRGALLGLVSSYETFALTEAQYKTSIVEVG